MYMSTARAVRPRDEVLAQEVAGAVNAGAGRVSGAWVSQQRKAEPAPLAVVMLQGVAEHPQETVFEEGVAADVFGLEPFKGEMSNCHQFLLHILESALHILFFVLSASGLGDSSLQVGLLPCNWTLFPLHVSRASFAFCFQVFPFLTIFNPRLICS